MAKIGKDELKVPIDRALEDYELAIGVEVSGINRFKMTVALLKISLYAISLLSPISIRITKKEK